MSEARASPAEDRSAAGAEDSPRQSSLRLHLTIGSCALAAIVFGALVLACASGETPPTDSPRTAEAPARDTASETSSENVVTSGTEVCVRCGALREVLEHGDGAQRVEMRATKARDWSSRSIDDCTDHAWERTGCWFTRSGKSRSVACSSRPDGHFLWEALAALDDEPARELGRRFASLPVDRQRDVWRKQARGTRFGTPREVAWDAALGCGFADLAAHWSG
jgi:hypothetical protein